MFEPKTWADYQELIRQTRFQMHENKLTEELLFVVNIGTKPDLGVDDLWMDWIWMSMDALKAELCPPDQVLNQALSPFFQTDAPHRPISPIFDFAIQGEWAYQKRPAPRDENPDYFHMCSLVTCDEDGRRFGRNNQGPRMKELEEAMSNNILPDNIQIIDYKPPMRNTKEWWWLIRGIKAWAQMRDREREYRTKVSETLKRLSKDLR